MDNMLTVKQVSERLNVTQRLVRWYIAQGTSSSPYANRKLTAYKIGREWRIKPSDLDKFIKGEEL